MMRSNDLKNRLKEGDVVAGPWCVLPSPDLIEIIGRTGMDFAILDMEHGPHSIQSLVNMVRAADACGCAPIVRVAKNDEALILHALDIGATGVIVPHIESCEDAYKAISYAKYHPLGNRGFSPYTRAGGYSPKDLKNHTYEQNNRTVLGLLLEGIEGINNLDEILAIKGISDKIDFIYIGAYDLSQAVGHPGEIDHPQVRNHLKTCINKIKKSGIAPGGYVAKNGDDMKWMCDLGMQIITLLPDCTLIYDAFASVIHTFDEIKPKERRK
ncbi:MAG: hypothetical protein JXQ82_09280 [Methanomicrobiaceae archaeon]|nr:hypothetical protein [Methanomicrobiaceae archaeon]